MPGPVSELWGQKAALRELKVSQRTGSEHVCGEFCSGGAENWWDMWLWGQGTAEGLAGL